MENVLLSVAVPAAKRKNLENVAFGGGCFWCVEAVFRRLKGVEKAVPGYAGGKRYNPSYEEVSSGTTGHAEVVNIEFDPKKISFHDLLAVFFASHDPTTPNRQGNDVGSQYRSVIFYRTESQRQEAREFIEELDRRAVQGEPVVTELKQLENFFPADESHLQYYESHKSAPYCETVITPKLAKIEEQFSDLLKPEFKRTI